MLARSHSGGGKTHFLEGLCKLDEEVRHAYELTKDFCSILGSLQGDRLDESMRAVEQSGINDL
jgi:hypothetical protein